MGYLTRKQKAPIKTLSAIKTKKIKEIKEAWQKADSGPLFTDITTQGGKQLVIQYSAYDKDVWFKKIIGVALECINKGALIVLPLGTTEKTLPNHITALEALDIQSGRVPPEVFLVIKDVVIEVKDYYNNMEEITLEQMQHAALLQNLQMEKDL